MQRFDNVIRAFSEDHVERLTGLTKRQLRYWDQTGFFKPEITAEDDRGPYSRMYSFRDVVGLKTLGILRNRHKVPLQHLREVARKLSDLGDELWVSTTLYVLNKRIVHIGKDGRAADAASGQYMLEVPLEPIISDVRAQVIRLNDRTSDRVGKIEKHKHVVHNSAVIAGTRIPVSAIVSFHSVGYSVEQILKEYPDLKADDVRAALAYAGINAAA